MNDQIESSNKQLRSIDQRSLDAHDSTMGAISNTAVVRYDAFDYGTNKLSFCLCMLDNFHNGIILTSIYGKEGSSIYLKEIVNGQSQLELSEYEDQALKKAKG